MEGWIILVSYFYSLKHVQNESNLEIHIWLHIGISRACLHLNSCIIPFRQKDDYHILDFKNGYFSNYDSMFYKTKIALQFSMQKDNNRFYYCELKNCCIDWIF